MFEEKYWGDYYMFQSHAGSIEAAISAPSTEIVPAFQSHAGSIEAEAARGLEMRRGSVSIPRWFD